MKLIQAIDKDPFYYERLSVTDSSVVMLTAAYRDNSNAVFLTIETNNIRYRIDGGDPGANDGHLVYAAGNLYLTSPKAVRNLRMIGSGGTATVIVTYYR